MKILKIVSSGYEEGGVENGVVLMQPIFEKLGHEVKIFSSNARPDLPHFNHFTYRKPSDNFIGRLLYSFNPFAIFALKKTLKKFNPDVVSVHTIGNASPAILLALSGYPTVFTIHGPELFVKKLMIWCFPKRYFKSKDMTIENLNFYGKMRYFYQKIVDLNIYNVGLRNVDKFVSLSSYMHKILIEDGIENTNVTYGTRIIDYHPLNKENLNHNIAFVGRLEVFKGVNYLIESMVEIVKKFPDAHLFVAGDGTEIRRLEQMVKDLDLSKSVSFLGHLSKDKIEEVYKKVSIVVLPSIWAEAFGKIGIEAMSLGRPVIASNVGGVSDWLDDGKNGYLIKEKDSKSIEDSVIKLFSNTELLINMSKEARLKSLDFDISNHVNRMVELYKEVINSKKQNKKLS